MVVTAALVMGFLWRGKRMKHSNFYPKQEMCPWTPVLTYHPSRSGSVLGASSWAMQPPRTFSTANSQTITWGMWGLCHQARLSRLRFHLRTPKPVSYVRQTLEQSRQQICSLWDVKMPAQPEEWQGRGCERCQWCGALYTSVSFTLDQLGQS